MFFNGVITADKVTEVSIINQVLSFAIRKELEEDIYLFKPLFKCRIVYSNVENTSTSPLQDPLNKAHTKWDFKLVETKVIASIIEAFQQ